MALRRSGLVGPINEGSLARPSPRHSSGSSHGREGTHGRWRSWSGRKGKTWGGGDGGVWGGRCSRVRRRWKEKEMGAAVTQAHRWRLRRHPLASLSGKCHLGVLQTPLQPLAFWMHRTHFIPLHYSFFTLPRPTAEADIILRRCVGRKFPARRVVVATVSEVRGGDDRNNSKYSRSRHE